ncbi:GNAT family N-acetyltransferase [Thermoanaerobacter wiegelii]|uniref:GCN5-related N-acetyltransferase n=1 Tax=Thermoanaerobacter wiegelii Rt8.B1 TaxID=697303 RepID=G2MRI2_9THEO|nr:GNAT family N-acetyltransferase [Thermoanaerobacter wiegelii]AEM79344.1 GCN5-related N-acetyltransferase [Thermoanaerobacter wiegelii Rt8.B1]
MGEIIYRQAVKEDYEKIHLVVKEGQDLHAFNRPDIFQSVEILFPQDYFNKIVSGEDTAFFVAEDQGEICGFAVVEIKHSSNHPSSTKRTYGYVSFMGVLKSHQRKGIGGNLYNLIVNWCKQKGVSRLELRVWSFNEAAVKFFLKKGFVEDFKQLSIPL